MEFSGLTIMYKSTSQFYVIIYDKLLIRVCTQEHCNFFKPCSSLLIVILVFLFLQKVRAISVILYNNDT